MPVQLCHAAPTGQFPGLPRDEADNIRLVPPNPCSKRTFDTHQNVDLTYP